MHLLEYVMISVTEVYHAIILMIKYKILTFYKQKQKTKINVVKNKRNIKL